MSGTHLTPNGSESVACRVDGCEKPCKARNLCATHYARWRRTGDPNKIRGAGRPRSQINTMTRQIFSSDWSERTLARYIRARHIFTAMSIEGYQCDQREATALATRPNGTMNISKFERIAEARLMSAIIDEADA